MSVRAALTLPQVGQDEVWAGCHGGKKSVEHGGVHSARWGFLIVEEAFEEVEFGVGERSIHAGSFGTAGEIWGGPAYQSQLMAVVADMGC